MDVSNVRLLLINFRSRINNVNLAPSSTFRSFVYPGTNYNRARDFDKNPRLVVNEAFLTVQIRTK